MEKNMSMVRVSFKKTFKSGIKAGMTLPVTMEVAESTAELHKANVGKVCKEYGTNAKYVVSDYKVLCYVCQVVRDGELIKVTIPIDERDN